MHILVLLLAAHFVADYPLQTDWVYLQKIRSYLGGSWHAAITFLTHLFFLLPYVADIRVIAAVAISVLLHQFQDNFKIIICERPRRHVILGYILDQALHITMAGVLALLFTSLTPSLTADQTLTFFWHRPLWAGLIAIMVVASFMVEITLFVVARAKNPQSMLQRNYRNMLVRGVAAGVLYSAVILAWQTWM